MALNDTLKTRILLRNDTLFNWGSSSLVLGKGEVAIATGLEGNLVEVRVGNNTTWANSAKLAVDASQIAGIVDLIQGTAKKYQVVANGEGGNSWKLQEAALSGGDWSDVDGSTWTVDFSSITDAIDGLTSDVNYISGIVDTKLDKTTFSTISNDIGLSVASVSNPVATKSDIASLDKVMHFKGVVTAVPTATTGYEVGDVVLVAGSSVEGDNGKEFVLVNTGTDAEPALEWQLIGDQNAISALNSYVDTQIGNLSNAVIADYATKEEVSQISSDLSTDYVGKISTAKTEAYNEALSDANAYTDRKIGELSIDNYATKEYVNGISSELSTETSRGIEAAKSGVIGKSTDLSTANTIYGAKKYAEVYADGKIAELNIDNYATKTEVSDVSVALSTDYDGKIAALSNVYIKHGECVQSDLSGFFILDCGGSSLRTDEPAATA